MNPISRRVCRTVLAVAAMAPACGLVLALATVGGCRKAATPPPAAKAGGQTPDTTPLRAAFRQQNKLDGRVALVEFGQVGCELSDQGLKYMNSLQKTDAIPGLAYVRVEGAKDAAAVEAYYKEKTLELPVVRDGDGAIAQAFGATAIPTFIVLDKFGRIRYLGGQPDKRLGEWVASLAAEKADVGPDVAMLGTISLDGSKLLAQTRLPDLAGAVKAMEGHLGPMGLVAMFVDTTCPFSSQAMRDMPTVAAELAARRIGSVVVNIDGDANTVKNYFSKQNLGAPVIYDVTKATKDGWGIQSVPTVMYVGPDKKIGYNGVAVWADVARAIERAQHLPQGSITFTARGTRFG